MLMGKNSDLLNRLTHTVLAFEKTALNIWKNKLGSKVAIFFWITKLV